MGWCDWCKHSDSDKCDNCIEYYPVYDYESGYECDDINFKHYEPKEKSEN